MVVERSAIRSACAFMVVIVVLLSQHLLANDV